MANIINFYTEKKISFIIYGILIISNLLFILKYIYKTYIKILYIRLKDRIILVTTKIEQSKKKNSIIKFKNGIEINPINESNIQKNETVTIKYKNQNISNRRIHKILTSSSKILGTRDTQQDSIFVDEQKEFTNNETVLTIGILCDGMGGMQGGAEASLAVINELKKEFTRETQINKMMDIPTFFETSIKKVNEYVLHLKDTDINLKEAGTTLTSVIIKNNNMYWVSVGDSRIYIFRNGEMIQITRDHNYYLTLMDKVLNNEITEDDAKTNPKKEALISFIGMDEIEIIDYNRNPFILLNGDIVLLCSDGLTKSLQDTQITKIITDNYGDLNETARLLPLSAFDASTDKLDNTSVVLMQYIE